MRCYCGQYDIDPEHAQYVKDGRPMCHPVTCERAAKRAVPIEEPWPFRNHRSMAEMDRLVPRYAMPVPLASELEANDAAG